MEVIIKDIQKSLYQSSRTLQVIVYGNWLKRMTPSESMELLSETKEMLFRICVMLDNEGAEDPELVELFKVKYTVEALRRIKPDFFEDDIEEMLNLITRLEAMYETPEYFPMKELEELPKKIRNRCGELTLKYSDNEATYLMKINTIDCEDWVTEMIDLKNEALDIFKDDDND